MQRGRWGVVGALALLMSTVVLAQPAPRTGTIEGRVTELGSGRPLADAQAAIITIQRGARTSETGAFRIIGVPAGTYAVKIIRIGYEATSATVTVTANQTSTVAVALKPSTTILDAIVVTGTGEQQRRREQGTNVAVISTENVPVVARAFEFVAQTRFLSRTTRCWSLTACA
jgi:5-deoxy-D-glucuronate isomerase